MLRLRWLALTLLLLPVAASAQFFEVSSLTDPIRPDRSPLALTEEVPAIFHLGLDSPASVFANPARAARAKHRFVYGTIRPNFSADQPVSFAALFGSRERRWLITVENGIQSAESGAMQRTDVMRNDPDFTEMRTDLRTFESDRVFSNTRARALLVGRTDFGGYAFGLYGGYRNVTDRRLTVSDSDIRTTEQRFSSDIESTRSEMSEDLRLNERDGFGIGAELALAGRTWDLATAVSYQRRTAETEFSNNVLRTSRSEERFDDGALFTNFDQLQNNSQSRADATPTAVDVELIGALRAGRKRDDYLFGAVTGTFGSGTADAVLSLEQERIRRTDSNGTVSGDTTTMSLQGRDDVDLSTRATQVSLGYVYAMKRRGLTVLAAINPTGGFTHTERVNVDGFGSTLSLSRQEDDVTTLALTLPLYVRFDVTRRLGAFGGGAYTYTYARTESDFRPISVAPSGDTHVVEQASERTSDVVSSSSALYAGAVMTFRSGLTAQAAFRGNLAEINGWTVSLGYRF